MATYENQWSNIEMAEAVKVYAEMRNKNFKNESFVKKHYYEELANKFGRTIKAFEYRMQNISYVYYLMGREYIPGLKPARGVSPNQIAMIQKLISKYENQISSENLLFNAEVLKIKSTNDYDISNNKTIPEKYNIEITQFVRDPKVVAWVLNNSKGFCECCNQKAPFNKEDGTPFLEVHHLIRLADGGYDSISNAIALCPNCHRELHYGENRTILLNQIYKNIERVKK